MPLPPPPPLPQAVGAELPTWCQGWLGPPLRLASMPWSTGKVHGGCHLSTGAAGSAPPPSAAAGGDGGDGGGGGSNGSAHGGGRQATAAARARARLLRARGGWPGGEATVGGTFWWGRGGGRVGDDSGVVAGDGVVIRDAPEVRGQRHNQLSTTSSLSPSNPYTCFSPDPAATFPSPPPPS